MLLAWEGGWTQGQRAHCHANVQLGGRGEAPLVFWLLSHTEKPTPGLPEGHLRGLTSQRVGRTLHERERGPFPWPYSHCVPAAVCLWARRLPSLCLRGALEKLHRVHAMVALPHQPSNMKLMLPTPLPCTPMPSGPPTVLAHDLTQEV